MKFLKYASIIPIAFSIGMAQASEVFYKVPFNNVEVKGASMIYADYAMDSHHQIMICEATPHGMISSIEWVYKDAKRRADLPIILKDDSRFVGHFADPDGRLTLTNDFGPDSIFVSCYYRDMN